MRLHLPTSWLSDRSLKARLYAIILLLGFLPLVGLALAGLAIRNAEGDHLGLDRAAHGSIQLERINGLIYRVVMESRGIYMSPDWRTAEPFANNLIKGLAELRDVTHAWKQGAIAAQRSNAEELTNRVEDFIAFRTELVRLAREESTAAARAIGDNAANRNVRAALNESLRSVARAYEDQVDIAKRKIEHNDRNVLVALTALAGVGALTLLGGIALINGGLLVPLFQIKNSMLQLAKGDLEVKVGGLERSDEMGQMARSVQVLQAASIERHKMNREAALLAELNEWLQCCKSLDELYDMVAQFLSRLLPDCAGTLYVYANSRDVLDSTKAWSGGKIMPAMHPDDCWALRRGRTYVFGDKEVDFPCAHVASATPGKYCCIPILAHGETIGLLHLDLHRSGQQGEAGEAASILEQRKLGMACAEQISLAIANVKLRDQLRDQSIRDPLTGLFNRRYLMETCRREFSRAARAGQCVTVLSLDVDHFKKFNDNHGHDAGDTVLRAVGECLQRNFRDEDIPCRFGGEEFAVIVPGASPEDGIRKAEDIRAKVEALVVRYLDANLPRITVSVGVAAFPRSGTTPQDVLKAADDALYRAKDEGRNRVHVAASLVDAEGPARGLQQRLAAVEP
jgi:diguanylate cyclase (GGDEF)-like protein